MDAIESLSKRKAVATLRSWVESPLFILVCGVLSTFFYMLNQPVWTIALLLACGSFILLFCEDSRPLLPVVLYILITLRFKQNFEAYTSGLAIAIYVVVGAPFVLSAVYRLWKKRATYPNKAGLLCLCVLAFGVLIGGVGSPYYSMNNFANALLIAGTWVAAYAFFAFTLNKREDNLLYLARVCAVAVCMISLQVLEIYVRHYHRGTPLDDTWKGEYVKFGWAISNMGGEMISFLLPGVFYLIYKERWGVLYYFLVLGAVVAVYFTLGRNALLGAGAVSVFGTLANCVFGKRKILNCVFAAALLAAVAGFAWYLYTRDLLQNITAFFRESGVDDHGRVHIWKEHFQLFLQYPVNGIGYKTYYGLSNFVEKAHNTLVQMIGSSGTIGLACYGVHRAQTMKPLCKSAKDGRLFLSGCIAVGLLMSLLSPLFFQSYFRIYYVVILVVLEKS